MNGRARLLGLRLQGFKSFADRTIVEFGAGISAVVGPNGSGKSNLADALRWTLGEQGRSLRIRKSEDVVWAGSERRPALGMADVTLIVDNEDGLLPVEFRAVEIGRRLFRSGENEYLLNRQRIRLRDLVELLDGANLAENAFLFIGQGLVDQALALRPEERRPLFEEVAGVRRHERRRRRAEEQLAESEANLARIEDILAELRPQARRLAAQAEQQASRRTAAEDLADGLLAVAHGRWAAAATSVAEAVVARGSATALADQAMTELAAAEAAAAATTADLDRRATMEAERRTAYDAAQTALTAVRLEAGRVAADRAAALRDRQRLVGQRSASDADLASQRRLLVRPVPEPDHDLESAVGDAERALAESLAEWSALRSASHDRDAERAAVIRARAARESELDTARRRLADANRRAADERRQAKILAERRAAVEADLAAASAASATAQAAEQQATDAREAARLEAERTEDLRRTTSDQAGSTGAQLAELAGRLADLDAWVAEDEDRGIARAARRRGGRRVDEDLVVDPGLRPVVEAILADASRAYVVGRADVPALADQRGLLVTSDERSEARVAAPGPDGAADRRCRQRISALGGGLLVDALRRDPTGAATALLARAAWLPDLAACLELQKDLPPGWLVGPRDGSAVLSSRTVALGRAEPRLERLGDRARMAADAERLRAEAVARQTLAEHAAVEADAARAALAGRRSEEEASLRARRRADEDLRLAARAAEAVAREAAWHDAQATRLAGEADRLGAAVAALEAGVGVADGRQAAGDEDPRAGLETWEARTAELRNRRDRLAAQLAEHSAARREAEGRRARAEAVAMLDEERLEATDRELLELSDREAVLEADGARLEGDQRAAVEVEARARDGLDELRRADAADRQRLAASERAASAARERLRRADERVRAADRAELEARLGLDSLREQLLVELAGLGDLAVERLTAVGGTNDASRRTGRPEAADPTGSAEAPGDADEPGDALRAALDAAGSVWATLTTEDEPPSPGRLATLRRRFHELGASNPDAIAEHRELQARLDGLEVQHVDLRRAIASTRELIAELDALIATQFRTTFQALEAKFDARFQQLFGGGYAHLILTDPADLAATGVEIVARPPGRKPQALAMLSGGERALTAVALLFAMLEVRPVPFCVLDEVDAALDEANVGRFTAALRDLSAETQFIVITHNRGTIEAADALYGVTLGDDSVSRVISLRLEEAREIAERVGAGTEG